MTVAAAVEALHREGVPAAPVNAPHEVLADAQVVHNRSLHTWDHPVAGTVRQPRHPVRFASSPNPCSSSSTCWASTPTRSFSRSVARHRDRRTAVGRRRRLIAAVPLGTSV